MGKWKSRMTRDCMPPIGILAASMKLPTAPPNAHTIPYSDRDPARCFRGACYVLLPTEGDDAGGWYNRGNGKRYCCRCAGLINQYNMAGERALCVPPGSVEIPNAD